MDLNYLIFLSKLIINHYFHQFLLDNNDVVEDITILTFELTMLMLKFNIYIFQLQFKINLLELLNILHNNEYHHYNDHLLNKLRLFHINSIKKNNIIIKSN